MSKNATTNIHEELRSGYQRYDTALTAVESIGCEHLETMAEALTQLDRLIHQYEDRATGTGDFGGYISFREQVQSLVENLPDDLPNREPFETVASTVDKRRLTERDFETIRETLEDVREQVGRLDEEAAAREAYRDLRRDANKRIDDIDDHLKEIDEQLALADVDLDAPVDEIKSPITAYNDAVRSTFSAYLESTSAKRVLSFFELTDHYPLVPVDPPPKPLVRYVNQLEEPLTIPELLEYAEYSQSKLAHYTNDPGALKTAVATDRTYLERISADPFTIDWPPPSSSNLRWRLQELIPVIDRFTDEETIVHLRSVRSALRDPDRFNRLRDVAIARDTLDKALRERIRSGELAAQRDRLARRQSELSDALDELPEP